MRRDDNQKRNQKGIHEELGVVACETVTLPGTP
jgi:hypothetical protein